MAEEPRRRGMAALWWLWLIAAIVILGLIAWVFAGGRGVANRENPVGPTGAAPGARASTVVNGQPGTGLTTGPAPQVYHGAPRAGTNLNGVTPAAPGSNESKAAKMTDEPG